MKLENGHSCLDVQLEVADLGDNEDLLIGLDLFKQLGYEIANVPFTWPSAVTPVNNITVGDANTTIPRPVGIGEDGIAPEWRKVLLTSIAKELKMPTIKFGIDNRNYWRSSVDQTISCATRIP